MKHLITGGARCGKSRYAEELAMETGKTLYYIATAEARDAEMAERISHHRMQRETGRWQLIEAPLDLAATLAGLDGQGHCLLVDCLTLWLSNALERQCWEMERESFLAALARLEADVLLVVNDVGSGVVPLGELSRRFVDECGRLQQDTARRCSHVTTVIAGLPLPLKEP